MANRNWWDQDVPTPNIAFFESTFVSFLNNMLVNSVAADSELVAARNGYSTLSDFLNSLAVSVEMWLNISNASRIDSTTILVPGVDMTATLTNDRAFRVLNSDSTMQYGHIVNQSYDGNDTTITVDFSVNAMATSFAYSRVRAQMLPSNVAGGGSGHAISKSFIQPGHGLVPTDLVYHNGTGWTKAQANAANTLAIGVVSLVEGDNITITTFGHVEGFTGLTPGQYYYTDPTTAGAYTATEPDISNVIFQALSATTVHVLPQRPVSHI